MASLSRFLDSVADRMLSWVVPVARTLVYFSAFLVMVMAFIVVLDVTLRWLFKTAILGVVEWETFMLGILCFLSLAHVMLQDGHVCVDIFKNMIPKQVLLIVDNILLVFGVYIFAMIAWQMGLRGVESYGMREISETSRIPFFPFILISSFGCGFLSWVLFIRWMQSTAKILLSLSCPWLWLSLGLVVAGLVMVSPVLLHAFSIQISNTMVGGLAILILLLLLFLGFPVAFSMAMVGILGVWYLRDYEVCGTVIRIGVYEPVANYFFATVPFFVLMGFLCLYSGVSRRLYDAGYKCCGGLPGGLAIGTLCGCGAFSAICGDSMSTAATMASVALPEMKKFKYDDALATGSLAAGGTLGILIPPSLGFIVYSLITEQSVGKLFMAGVIPGIILVSLYCLMVYVRCRINPALGPPGPKTSFVEKLISLKGIWPVAFLFLMVVGGIYKGFFTATEGGAIGAAGALIVGLVFREMTWRNFFKALLESTEITAMVACILFGVAILGYLIALTEIPMALSKYINELQISRYAIYLLVLLLYVVLGMLMNIIPMVMLTLPIIYPTILALGFDPIWFGVIMVIMMEMGQISPPVGINVFVIAGMAKGVPMATVFRGIFWFIVMQIIMIIILTIWPDIALVLPNSMETLKEIK